MSTTTVPAAETVGLRDGLPVTIRPIRADDAPRLQALHSRLSSETIYRRFLGPHPQLSAPEAERLANVDYAASMAFVAALPAGDDEMLIGVARYAALGPQRPGEAEAAIVIEDRYQSRGLGRQLLERLAAYAKAHGVRVFVAEVSTHNDRILHFIRRNNLPLESKLEAGVWEIRVTISE
jgi:acetyltransferase